MCSKALPAGCCVSVFETLKSLEDCLEKLKNCVVLCDFDFLKADEELSEVRVKNQHEIFFLTTLVHHEFCNPRSVIHFPFGFSRILEAIDFQSKKDDELTPAQKKILLKFAGSSAAVKKLRMELLEASEFRESVLITGETGTGKSLAAKLIHELSASGGNEKRLVTENISAIPASLIEAELFGSAEGAYTDSKNERKGLLALADKGSIFLDEIGDMPLELQSKLLLAVQEGVVRQVGSDESRKLDVRFIFATNKNLRQKMKEGLFREDLFYRISATEIYIPPLREHKEDIAEIADEFFFVKGLDFELSPQSVEKLKSYDWPGNVRELEHSLLKAARRCARNKPGQKIITPDLIHFSEV